MQYSPRPLEIVLSASCVNAASENQRIQVPVLRSRLTVHQNHINKFDNRISVRKDPHWPCSSPDLRTKVFQRIVGSDLSPEYQRVLSVSQLQGFNPGFSVKQYNTTALRTGESVPILHGGMIVTDHLDRLCILIISSKIAGNSKIGAMEW